MHEYDLAAPDEICRLSDVDTLRTAGIGRQSLNAIREKYPSVYEEGATNLKIQLRKIKREHKQLLERSIGLGSVHGVNAVRFAPDGRAVEIQTSEHDQLFLINIVWSPSVKKPVEFDSFGFGEIDQSYLIPMGVALPALTLVERVSLDGPDIFDDFIAFSLQLQTGKARFRVTLFCDK